ncbi:MAG: GntR family transcriptional regulator [Anaerolineaceae bacterium]|nr:GntR family transcriptional regulator [Anaerolineaceae bacterium]
MELTPLNLPVVQARLVNRQNKLPLYQQLYEILRGYIQREEWEVGKMIPAEPELMEQFGVSRTTVRQVLDRLVTEGMIYRQQGRGSFVAEPTLEQGLMRIVSFTEDMRQRGLQPGTQMLAAELEPASEEVAEKLEVQPGEEMVRLERLRLANGEPMSIEVAYLVHRLCRGLLERYDFSKNPLREALERDYGLHLASARQVIRAIVASPTQARLLHIPSKSPLLFIERVSYSQQAVPAEYLHIYYRADRYSLYNELHD